MLDLFKKFNAEVQKRKERNIAIDRAKVTKLNQMMTQKLSDKDYIEALQFLISKTKASMSLYTDYHEYKDKKQEDRYGLLRSP